MKLAKKRKVQLVQGAARLGLWALTRQTWLILMDSVVRKRHLVFRLDAVDCARIQGATLGETQLREILSVDDFQQRDSTWLNDPAENHDWGEMDWLERGWRLWVLEQNEEVLALAWTRLSKQSLDFFVPLDENEELFWHAYVLPSHRGRNFQEKIWAAIASQRVADGVLGFFTNCRDYNLPSRTNIGKMGFSPIGHCDESRITSVRVWRSYSKKSDQT